MDSGCELKSLVKETIDAYQMLAPGDRVLVAVSGGPDSMALLHLLQQMKLYTLGVFHLNHGFRSNALAEALLVEKTAAGLGLPAFIFTYDVPKHLAETGESKQQGARQIRYRLMRECATENHYTRIALAHHADDQAETVLLRILRGTGPKGLGGIPPQRGPYVRPLIRATKDMLLAYCRQHKIDYCVDESNLESVYFRNKVRNQLIPFIEAEFSPKLRQNLCRLADLCRDDDQELARLTEEVSRERLFVREHQVWLDRGLLGELSPALQRRVLRLCLQRQRGNLQRIELQHIEMILRRESQEGAFRLQLPGVAVQASGDWLIFGTDDRQPRHSEVLEVPGMVQTEWYEVHTARFLPHNLPARQDGEEDFDLDALALPLVVRSRQPGDRLHVFGGGRRRIKDILIDAKIPRELRDQIPVICDQEDILMLGTLRRSEKGRITKTTRRILRISLRKRQDCHGVPPVL